MNSRSDPFHYIALGIDLFNGTLGLYEAVKPIAEINGVQDIVKRIGKRFEGQGRKKTAPSTPAAPSSSTPPSTPPSGSIDSAGL